MTTICRSAGGDWPPLSPADTAKRKTNQTRANRYEQTEILSANGRWRQCRPRRTAHFSE
jgi:hypothetical protein